MWRKLVNWYDALENEQIAVLERPELAELAAPGFRRWNARKLAALPPIERARVREFCLTYRGRRLHKALAKWAAFFTLAGVLLHLVRGAPGLLEATLLANLIGFGLLPAVLTLWYAPSEIMKTKRTVLIGATGGALIGAFGAFAALMLAKGRPVDAIFPRLQELAIGAVVAGLALWLPMLLVSAYRRRHYVEQAARLQREAEREKLARELSEAQLRMLRAQIEPHFLFNTLGAVQQLSADGAPRAAALTADLIAFLRASFSDMRAETVSLASEFTTVASYLRVMQARMGARLRFELSLPDALARTAVPSMIVLTLVENAIKHGIEPSLHGGEIHLAAMGDGDSIRIRVHDSGVGMSDTPGNGAGLDNVRRRLQLAYGDTAGLALLDADPGLVAEITIPATVEVAA
ncbi:sensor histidine kinase [Massilia sp. IC2-476]|uniref:sensor histidine kinase n=1 Tax=Massilia sp. IC2-476 TaxID=2887199 RepID=UPI001D1060D9|nr:histidine kinase [Massilia sp. IC2-476]MCC2973844.1 histidine kinase [Massilia sp. IC2-476]